MKAKKFIKEIDRKIFATPINNKSVGVMDG
jgi:hypothetical protein